MYSYCKEKGWNSPYINHFISADTVISSYTNPQDLNRYSYVSNNPLRYNDPTGHVRVGDDNLEKNKASMSCSKNPQYCTNGKKKSADELAKMRNKNSSEDRDKDPVVTALRGISTGLDILAGVIDLYDVGVVTAGGIMGAGIGLPFTEGGPEVPVVTGWAGIGIAELAVQPTLQFANGLALTSTILTAAADIRSGDTNLKTGVIGKNTLNSTTTTILGFAVPEAYSSFALQSLTVSNDLGWTSFPFH